MAKQLPEWSNMCVYNHEQRMLRVTWCTPELHDTDSVIYKTKPGQEKLPLGRYLGQFTDELGGNSIVGFCSGGAKD